jgi:hypothetical protein
VSSDRFSPRLASGTIAILSLIAVGIAFDLYVALRGDRADIPTETMTRAKEAVVALRKPGDWIVHSPIFSPKEIAALGDLSSRPDLPAPELRASRRIVVIDYAPYPMYGFGSPSEVKEIGDDVAIRVFEPGGSETVTLFDLYADIERAEQRIERPRGTVTSRCTAPRSEGGRSCPAEADWLYLAQRQLTVSGQNAPCVWAHPTTGGEIVISIPPASEPPPGRKLELQLSAALTDDAVSQTPDGASVRSEVEQNGKALGGVTVPNQKGWVRASITIEPKAAIEIRVTTARDGRRHHCVNARLLEVPVR